MAPEQPKVCFRLQYHLFPNLTNNKFHQRIFFKLMSLAILVAGATGNTGRSTTETLSKLLQAPNSPLRNHRILALTRSANSPVAQHLATLPGVEIIQQLGQNHPRVCHMIEEYIVIFRSGSENKKNNYQKIITF